MTARQRWTGGAGALLLILLPPITSPVLVTTDGPSHVYNAWVAQQDPAVASAFTYRAHGGPNRAADFLLRGLGRVVGWEPAERMVFALAAAGTLIAVILAVPARGGAVGPLAGWIAQGWFLWQGFYDFSLSLAAFAGIVGIVQRPRSTAREAGTAALLWFAYVTHFFTFLVASALVALAAIGDTWQRRCTWRGWIVPGVAFAVAAYALLGSHTVGGALVWPTLWKSVAGLVAGDFIVSFHWAGFVVGVALMGLVWVTLGRAIQSAWRLGWQHTSVLEAFALLALLGSLVVPFGVGEGSYIPARLRILAVIALLPSALLLLASHRHLARVVAGGLLVGLALHASVAIRAGSRVARDVTTIDGLLATAGIGPGSWVRAQFANDEGTLFRVSGYAHLVERVCLRHRAIALDNYEAGLRIFPVTWRAQPDLVRLRLRATGWEARLEPHDLAWGTPLLIVHEADRPISSADPRLSLHPVTARGGFAVTEVRRVGS